MSTQPALDRWQRLARGHAHRLAALGNALLALDAEWPALETSATEAVLSGQYTYHDVIAGKCTAMNAAFVDYPRRAEALQSQIGGLQRLMQRHLAKAAP